MLKFFRSVATEKGEVAYKNLISQMNWRDCPVPPMQYEPSSDPNWVGTQQGKGSVSMINYQNLLDDCFGKGRSSS